MIEEEEGMDMEKGVDLDGQGKEMDRGIIAKQSARHQMFGGVMHA